MNAWIVSHSHWDREWYLPYESHRYYFVQLMDQVIALLEEDQDFHSFHLDGQTLLLEDYLKVRPTQEKTVEKLLIEGKLVIGPWYVLQDAFLTSPEANVRNLLYGIEIARCYQQKAFIGYFPDTFGIYGQAPQILKLCNIGTAAFGRGVTPTGFNNEVKDDPFASTFSELRWQSPDGSSVLGILFANWYSNGNEMPTGSESEIRDYWDERIKRTKRFSATDELLFMNGCDHQPAQKDASLAIEKANALYSKEGQVKFHHTSLINYVQKLYETLPGQLDTISGELVNQRTDGWSTLVNTASSRMRLKKLNAKCQRRLERELEPLVLLTGGQQAHKDYLAFLWKSLMENHPHDSICGCSVDSVHREMTSRFERVIAAMDTFKSDLLRILSGKIDASKPESLPIMVVDTSPIQMQKNAKASGFLDKIYFKDQHFSTIADTLEGQAPKHYQLFNEYGDVVPHQLTLGNWEFGYDLPMDGFRQPFYGRTFEVEFPHSPVKAPNVAYYYLKQRSTVAVSVPQALIVSNSIENPYLKVTVNPDRTFNILDKTSGQQLTCLGEIISEGDIGNAYMFTPSADGLVIHSTDDALCSIEQEGEKVIKSAIGLAQRLVIQYQMFIPESADLKLLEEQRRLVWLPERTAGRSAKSVAVSVKLTLTLTEDAQHLDLNVQIDNCAKDHRIRILFKHPEKLSYHYAHSVFEIVKRDNNPSSQWQHPNFDQRLQRYVSFGEKQGITIATEGLHEYEICNDNTIAITLLRATGEMGDWGYFPTPEGQEPGLHEADLAIKVHPGNLLASKAYHWAETSFDEPLFYVDNAIYVDNARYVDNALADKPDQRFTSKENLLTSQQNSKVEGIHQWSTEEAVITAIKAPQYCAGMVMRCYNPLDRPVAVVLNCRANQQLLQVNLLEEPIAKLVDSEIAKGDTEMTHWLKPYEITTFLWQN